MLNPAAYENSTPDGIGVLEISQGPGAPEDRPRQFVPLKRTELRGEVGDVRTEFRGEIAGLRGELHEAIGGLHREIAQLRIFMLAGLVTILAAVIGLHG